MLWASPIWLIGLIPWGLLTIWLCLGRLPRSGVPFLPLWQGTSVRRKINREFSLPPLAFLFMLIALLLAVLAAARPFSRRLGGSVTLVLDRGLTMSALQDGKPRFVQAAERVAPHLSAAGEIRLVDPLGSPAHLRASAWLNEIRARPQTAINTKDILPLSIARALEDASGPVLVLTDQAIANVDPRLVLLRPSDAIVDVGIVQIAARSLPAAQVMVRVGNQSATRRCALAVRNGDNTVQRQIDLPSSGQTKDYFIDLPSLGESVEARLSPNDDLPADDAAWLVRTTVPMRIEARTPIDESLQHFVQVYTHVKAPAPDAPVAVIVNKAEQLAPAEAGVIASPAANPLPAGDRRVVTDALTKIVNWKQALAGARIALPPGGDWTPLITVGNTVLLAKRESPTRQVWVGFSQPDWSKSADYVVFWTNVFDWVAGDAPRWTSTPVQQLPSVWKPLAPLPSNVQANSWPGIYRLADTTLAMNCDMAAFPTEIATGPLDLHLPVTRGNRSWSPYLFLAAIGCAILSLAVWPRRRARLSPGFAAEKSS